MTKILTTLFFTFLITYYNRRTGCGAKLRPCQTYQMIEIEIHWFNNPRFHLMTLNFRPLIFGFGFHLLLNSKRTGSRELLYRP
jgi:hypothetical protein